MAISMTPPAGAGDFLARAGWGGALVLPLAGDASFRRYFRVVDGARQAVLMDAPPPHEDPRPFIHVAEYLTGIGLSAPAILARDLDQGLLLIEDFGSVRMRETVDPSGTRPSSTARPFSKRTPNGESRSGKRDMCPRVVTSVAAIPILRAARSHARTFPGASMMISACLMFYILFHIMGRDREKGKRKEKGRRADGDVRPILVLFFASGP